ncbi:hypothetical protein ACFC3F_07840 [Microbacterium sp. NPDC055910]|uniref:hypothetical protein n=1 Tax=Microbacterium sp. NPDC055910 TaxID=3345659 RepID=UPI0035DE0383
MGVFRWVFGLYLLLFDARWFSWLDQTPDAFFTPPLLSLSSMAGGFPPSPFFTIVDLVGLAAICAMTCGWATRISTSVALVTYIVSTTFAYSQGKISHQIAIALVLVCMLIADWGKAAPRRIAQGLSLLGVALCFGFLVAGVEKSRYWLTPDLGVSGFLSWYYPRMDLQEPQLLAGLVPGVLLLAFKAADVIAVLFEVSGFIWLLWGRVPWRLWLLAAASFHLVNALVLNITFSTQIVAYAAFFSLATLPWPARGERAYSAARITAVAIAVFATVWHGVTRIAGGGSFFIFGGSLAYTGDYDLIVCIVVGSAVVALGARDVFREIRRPSPREASVKSVGSISSG